MLTVAQAAQETGLSRVAIYKAVKAGRISAQKDDNGKTWIDPAELFRVYKPVVNQDNKSSLTQDNQLTEKELELTRQLLRQVESERDYLRQSVEHLQTSLNHALTMLTHQPEPSPKPEKQPTRSLLFEKLFGRK
jgi:predicted site-specific integrase-resolvase